MKNSNFIFPKFISYIQCIHYDEIICLLSHPFYKNPQWNQLPIEPPTYQTHKSIVDNIQNNFTQFYNTDFNTLFIIELIELDILDENRLLMISFLNGKTFYNNINETETKVWNSIINHCATHLF